MGLGAFELGYLRDKEKREVDFRWYATANPGSSPRRNTVTNR